MKRFFGVELALVVALSGVMLVGCGDREPAGRPADDAPAADPIDEQPADEAAAVNEAQAEIEEALAGLSEDERQAVLAQAICPVSSHPLGSMGEPIKVEVDGKDVYICCAGCENPLKEDPEKYMDNLSTL